MTATFLLLSKRGCSHCQRARRLLRELGYEFAARYPSKQDLERETGRNTYPQIYSGEKHIGGFDDLRKYLGLVPYGDNSVKQCCSGTSCKEAHQARRAKLMQQREARQFMLSDYESFDQIVSRGKHSNAFQWAP